MTCRYFRPNLPIVHQVGAVGVSQTADACELLVPWRKNHKEIRRALHDKGFLCSPTPFDCPFAFSERWRDCPFFEQTEQSG